VGQRFCASVALLVLAFMILAFVLPAVAAQPPDQQPPRVCPICHEEFSSHMKMLAHHYLAHFEIAHCYCFICGMEFSTLSGAATHILTHAETERVMYCPFCRTKVHEVDPDPYAMYVHWTTVHDW